jgi:N-dimethylarginine dimethylaminohydrolase
MVGRLNEVLVVDPRSAFQDQDTIDRQWSTLNYLSRPDLVGAIEDFDFFVARLRDLGSRVHLFESSYTLSLDSIYVRDSSLITPDGKAIICRMGKGGRSEEPASVAAYYRTEGIPILDHIRDPGTLEGGDVVWLDSKTIVVGRSYRTNQSGIDQLRSILADQVDNFVVVDLPHFRGPDDVLHLMSMMSPLRSDTLLVHRPLMPVTFVEWLESQDYRLIDIAPTEYDSLGCNVLAFDEDTCLMVEGNPLSRGRIKEAGISVIEFPANDLCLKGSGGPTCLTRPLHRS